MVLGENYWSTCKIYAWNKNSLCSLAEKFDDRMNLHYSNAVVQNYIYSFECLSSLCLFVFDIFRVFFVQSFSSLFIHHQFWIFFLFLRFFERVTFLNRRLFPCDSYKASFIFFQARDYFSYFFLVLEKFIVCIHAIFKFLWRNVIIELFLLTFVIYRYSLDRS